MCYLLAVLAGMTGLAVVCLCAVIETIIRDTPSECREPYIQGNYHSVRERLGYEEWPTAMTSTVDTNSGHGILFDGTKTEKSSDGSVTVSAAHIPKVSRYFGGCWDTENGFQRLDMVSAYPKEVANAL